MCSLVNYERISFIELIPVVNVMKTFTTVSNEASHVFNNTMGREHNVILHT